MDKVFIQGLLARGIIGVNEWEREKPQDIVINIVLFADLRKAGETDNIKDSVDYRTIAKKALSHAETAKKFTVEALASEIADLCLQESNVEKVQVKVEKPGAVRFSQSVGVEVERKRE